MKLVYIVQYYPPHTGGLEKVAQKQAESAAAVGHDVSVVTFAVPGARVGARREGDVTVHRMPGWHVFDRRFGIPFCLGGGKMVRMIFREVHAADVVHMHDVFYLSSLIAYIAARWHKKTILLTQHVAVVSHSSSLVVFIERLVYALWGRRIFRASKTIITYQTIVRDFLLSQGVPKEKILEVHNGIELDAFARIDEKEKRKRRLELGLPVNRPLVLFVGRMVPKKGHRALFEARDPGYDLVFVGPGEVPLEWYHTEGVHILGQRTQVELMYLYPAMDAFAAPSQSEMFTLVMQEAFACGLPVVTTDAPEYESYHLDRARVALCEPEASALKRELTRIVQDAGLRREMATYSRSLAEKYFDWNKNVRPTLALYEALTYR